jgi:hypothetical protein
MSFIVYCIVPGCDSSNQSSALFEIPQNDSQLLEKWKKQFPLLDSIQNKSRSICQNHFRSHDLTLQSDGVTLCLMPGAVPTLFNYELVSSLSDICRFCMSSFDNSKRVEISDGIKKHYQDLMQIDLTEALELPIFSCLECLLEIQKALVVKTRILKIQDKFHDMLSPDTINIKTEVDPDDVKLEMEDGYSDEEDVLAMYNKVRQLSPDWTVETEEATGSNKERYENF